MPLAGHPARHGRLVSCSVKRNAGGMKNGAILILFVLAVCLVPVVSASTEEVYDNATNYYNLGEIAINAGQYEKAIEYFDKALANNTTLIQSGDAYMYLYKDKAAALTDLGRYDEALGTINAGLVQFKNSTGMWNNKGYVLYKMGRYSEAVEAYDHAVTIDPGYVKGWINKGIALNASGRYPEAADAYRKALALDSTNADATQGLAAAEKASGATGSMTVILLVVLVIAAAGAAVWYVKFRAPAEADNTGSNAAKKAEKKAGKNKK